MKAIRRTRASVILALIVAGLSACGDSKPAELDQAAEARAREANQAVLDSLPDLSGRTFDAYHEVGPPPGGSGLMAEVIYAAPPDMTPPEIVEFFEQAMPGWEPICRFDRRATSATTLRRGDAWLVVSAGDYELGSGRTPGFTIAVNALDGEIMERDFVSRQRCG